MLTTRPQPRSIIPGTTALQAVSTPGEPVELVGKFAQHEGDAQRHHESGQIRAAQNEHACQQAKQGRDGRSGNKPEQRFGYQRVRGQQPGRIGAQAEERRMPERQDPGITENEIERQGEQAEDGDLGQNQMSARCQEQRADRGRPEHRLEHAPARPVRQRPRDVVGGHHRTHASLIGL